MAVIQLAGAMQRLSLTSPKVLPLVRIPMRTNIAADKKQSKWIAETLVKKYEVPVKWTRPEKTPFDHPSRTGDRAPDLVLDLSLHPTLYEQSKEFKDANELVKKFFSFEFMGIKEAGKRASDETLARIANHKYDRSSTEVQIAAMTMNIRRLRPYWPLVKKRKTVKIYYKELIDKRRKRLKLLRRWDYKRFEWLLEHLDLEYRNVPDFTDRVERKKSIRKLTAKYCEEYRAAKLKDYKEFLHSQKADFLREKIETLRWIQVEEADCGVQPTVTDDDIEKTEKMLQDHLSTLKIEVKEDKSVYEI